MTIGNRAGYVGFALRVLGIFAGLAVVTALLAIGVRAWAPGFELQALHGLGGQRGATLPTIAGMVTDAGSFALLAPLSIAFLLLRRWKRPFDDIAPPGIDSGSCA